MFRKLTKTACGVALVLVTCVVNVTAREAVGSKYDDMPAGLAGKAIVNIIDKGILSGYGGKIYPKEPLKRIHLAAVINRIFGSDSTGTGFPVYSDLLRDEWYSEDVASVINNKTMVGYNDEFNPLRDATREEVYAVLARAMSIPPAKSLIALEPFSDRDQISDWATYELAAMIENGYMLGVNGKLKPKATISREEFALVINRIAYINEKNDQ